MNSKFSLKVIQQGKTQKVHLVTPGSGIQGQALVLDATQATRYQLADIVTLVAPEKMQMKRVGPDLQIALPGGDVDAPDILIRGYYTAQDVTLQGLTSQGQWLGYTTANLVDVTSTASAGAATSSGWFSNWFTPGGVQSVGMAEMSGASVIGGGVTSGWLVSGALVGALALGGRGGGGGGSVTDTSAAAVIQRYASSSGASASPTAAQYKDMGITLPSSVPDALNLLNAVVALQSSAEAVNSSSKLNSLLAAMTSAYNKVQAEANGTAADATPDSAPLLSDYASLGVKVPDAIGNQTSTTTGAGNETLKLLNAALAELSSASVSSLSALKTLASTANDVMLLAKGQSAAQSDSDFIAGLNALLGGAQVSSVNVAAVKTAIQATGDDGTEVDSIAALKTVVDAQVLKSYAANGDGTSATAPALQTYMDAGVFAPDSLSTDTNTNKIPLNDPAALLAINGISASTWQAALASALVKRNADLSLLSSTSEDITRDIITVIQHMVNGYYHILGAADGDAKATPVTPTLADYTRIGVTLSSNTNALALVNDYVGSTSLKAAAVDTVGELNAVAQAAYNIVRLAAPTTTQVASLDYSTATNAPWVAGLNTLLGGSSVTDGNVATIKAAIGATGAAAAVDTVQEVQALVGLARMKIYTDNPAPLDSKTAIAPTLAEWGSLVKVSKSLTDASTDALNNVTFWKNTPTALSALNSALDTYGGSSLTDSTKLQPIADSWYRVLQTADGDRTQDVDVSKLSLESGLSGERRLVKQDFTNLGVKGSAGSSTSMDFAGTAGLLASVIGRLPLTSVDSVADLNALADVSFNVMQQAAGNAVTYTDRDWVTQLGNLSIQGATATNIADIKTKLTEAQSDWTKVDSYNELQSLVSLVRINDYAQHTQGVESPVLGDYQAVMATNDDRYATQGTDLTQLALSGNLSAYNDAVSVHGAEYASSSSVATMVGAYNLVLALADGNRNNTPSAQPTNDSYNAILGTQLTGGATNAAGTVSHLLNDVVDGLSASAVNTVSQLLEIEKTVDQLIQLASGTGFSSLTSQGQAALDRTHLSKLGLNDGAGHTFTDINSSSFWITDTEMAAFLNNSSTNPNSNPWRSAWMAAPAGPRRPPTRHSTHGAPR